MSMFPSSSPTRSIDPIDERLNIVLSPSSYRQELNVELRFVAEDTFFLQGLFRQL